MPDKPPPLILASRSPRRRELLAKAGYQFEVIPASETAECGVCAGEPPQQLVARYALQKAKDVAQRLASGVVLGCDTIACCHGQILGKPRDSDDARRMLMLMRGNIHSVFSGIYLWHRPSDQGVGDVVETKLKMDVLADEVIDEYVESGQWEGKAGGFGYQDRLGWIHIVEGSESNVVGLPLERLQSLLSDWNASLEGMAKSGER